MAEVSSNAESALANHFLLKSLIKLKYPWLKLRVEELHQGASLETEHSLAQALLVVWESVTHQ